MSSHARIVKAAASCIRLREDRRGANRLVFELRSPEGESLMRLVNPAMEKLADELEAELEAFDRSRPAFLDYLFSSRSVTAEDRKLVDAGLADFASEDIDVRQKASLALEAIGRPGWVILSALDRKGMDAETESRVADVLRSLNRWNALVDKGGLDHDVGFLARLSDRRGYERLKRILGGVRPFSKDGLPEAGSGLADYLEGWLKYSKDRVRWDKDKDRFEER